MEWLSLAFMQRALLAALITGVTAPAIGTFLVQRRLSLLGDGLGHLAVAGVGLAFLTGTAPLPMAVVICVLGSIGIEMLRESGRASGDVGLAILFYGGLSGGLLLAGLAGQGAGTLSGYLFGSLLTVNAADLWVIAGLGIVVLVVTLGLLPQLFTVSADEPFARSIGLPARFLNILVVSLAAITVTVSMRTVGLLLVSALMVVPVATANHVVIGFRTGLLASMGLGAVAAAQRDDRLLLPEHRTRVADRGDRDRPVRAQLAALAGAATTAASDHRSGGRRRAGHPRADRIAPARAQRALRPPAGPARRPRRLRPRRPPPRRARRPL